MIYQNCKLNFILSVPLTVLLLTAVVISCKKEFANLETDDSSGKTLLASNIERPGTDCKVTVREHLQTNRRHISRFVFMQLSVTVCFPLKVPVIALAVSTDKKHHNPSDWQSLHDGMQQRRVSTKVGAAQNHKNKLLPLVKLQNICETFFKISFVGLLQVFSHACQAQRVSF